MALLLRLSLMLLPAASILTGGIVVISQVLDNGDILAFGSDYNDTNTQFYLLDVNTGIVLRLTYSTVSIFNLTWSPNGEYFTFATYGFPEAEFEVYAVDIQVGELINLSHNPAPDTEPDWSPNGDSIAFQSERSGNREIYILNLASGQLTNISNNPSDDISPQWSPDGSKIAFTSYRDGNFEIYVADVRTGQVTNLTNNPAIDMYPAWSPDGSRIAFTSGRGADFELDFQLFTVAMNSGQIHQLTHPPLILFDAPQWSPDGSQILFHSGDFNADVEIYVVDASGSSPRNLTNNPSRELGGRWSPDGSSIAFISDRTGNQDIYLLDVQTGSLKRLTYLSFSSMNSPLWQPDRSIAWQPNP